MVRSQCFSASSLSVLVLSVFASAIGLADVPGEFREPNPYEHFYLELALAAKSTEPCERISASALFLSGNSPAGFQVQDARSKCYEDVARETSMLHLCDELAPLSISELPRCFQQVIFEEAGAEMCAQAEPVPTNRFVPGRILDGSGHSPQQCKQNIAEGDIGLAASSLGLFARTLALLGYTLSDIINECQRKVDAMSLDAMQVVRERFQQCLEYEAEADCRASHAPYVKNAIFRHDVQRFSYHIPYQFCDSLYEADTTTFTVRLRDKPVALNLAAFAEHVAQTGEILTRLDRLPDYSDSSLGRYVRGDLIPLAADSIWRKRGNSQNDALHAMRAVTGGREKISQARRLEFLASDNPALRFAALDKHKMGYQATEWTDLPWAILQTMYDDPDKSVRWKARKLVQAANDIRYADILTSSAALDVLLEEVLIDKDARFRKRLAAHVETPVGVLQRLSSDDDSTVRLAVAKNANTPISALQMLANDPSPSVRAAVARHPETPFELRRRLSHDAKRIVRHGVIQSRSADLEILLRLANDSDEFIRKDAASAIRYMRSKKDTDISLRITPPGS